MGKSIETEKRPVFARARGEGCGGDCFLSTGFPSGKMKMFWNSIARFKTGNVMLCELYLNKSLI